MRMLLITLTHIDPHAGKQGKHSSNKEADVGNYYRITGLNRQHFSFRKSVFKQVLPSPFPYDFIRTVSSPYISSQNNNVFLI